MSLRVLSAFLPARLLRGIRWVQGRPAWAVGFAYVLLLLLGWALRDSYGLSMDETPLLGYGGQAWEYLFRGAAVPTAIDWKFHSPALQLAILLFVKIFDAQGHQLILAKHFFYFVIFSIGWLAFVGLARRLVGWWWALLGGLWLVLTPRIFAHAFYNPKDIPGLAFFTLGVLLLVRLHERPTLLRILLFGIAAGFTISLRPFAILLPCFAVLLLGYEAWRSRGGERRSWLLVTGGTLLAVAALTVAVWPLLWHDPLRNFLGAISNNVSRGDEGFYLGKLPFKAGGHPWHYLFVWLGVSVPVAYSVLFLVGAGVTLWWAVRRPFALLEEAPVVMLALLWFGLPVVARLLGRIGLFDEWRHVMFIYSAFLLLALLGLQWLLDVLPRTWMRAAVILLLAFNMASTALWMVRNHPFEYMYFTMPAGWAQGKMDLDYWGLSYREGLRWVLANDPRPQVNVYFRDTNAVVTSTGLMPEERSRVRVMQRPDNAEYIFDTLRWSAYEHVVPADRVLHALSVDDNAFLWIYKGPYSTDKYPIYTWCDYCYD